MIDLHQHLDFGTVFQFVTPERRSVGIFSQFNKIGISEEPLIV